MPKQVAYHLFILTSTLRYFTRWDISLLDGIRTHETYECEPHALPTELQAPRVMCKHTNMYMSHEYIMYN